MINDKKFRELAEQEGKHMVSIYIPTYRDSHNQEDRLRLKNALNDAREELERRAMSEKEATQFLQKGYGLLDQERFFSYLSDGMALFFGEDYFHHEIMPVNFNPYIFVGHKFFLRPLLPVLGGEDRFFLLAISQKDVRFFEGHKYSITPVKIEDLMPTSMEEAFEFGDVTDHLQHHSGQGVRHGKQPPQSAMFHGHGQGNDDRSDDIKVFLQHVDKGLMEMLYDEKPPMVIAAVDSLVPLYKEVNNYKYLLEESVSGNPDREDPVALHEKAWEIVKKHLNNQRKEDAGRFEAEMARDKASAYLYDIVPAAINGKVDTLFLNKDEYSYGTFKEKENTIELHEERKGNEPELLDLAAVKTYLQGGRVHIVQRNEMPAPTANLNAIYRY